MNVATQRTTLSSLLERLESIVTTEINIAAAAGRIADDLAGPVPEEADSSPGQALPNGYIDQLNALLERLAVAQGNTRYAHSRVFEALDGDQPAEPINKMASRASALGTMEVR